MLKLEGSQSEKRNFGDIDSAVEYISHRVHENFTIYATGSTRVEELVKEIRKRVSNVIKQG